MNLKKNQNQPPPSCLARCALSFCARALPRSLGGWPSTPAALGWYRFLVEREMMSWLSASSPVSAEKPRYATGGILTSVTVKHSVQVSSDLYWSSSLRDFSAK